MPDSTLNENFKEMVTRLEPKLIHIAQIVDVAEAGTKTPNEALIQLIAALAYEIQTIADLSTATHAEVMEKAIAALRNCPSDAVAQIIRKL